jgi:hypothetical protein
MSSVPDTAGNITGYNSGKDINGTEGNFTLSFFAPVPANSSVISGNKLHTNLNWTYGHMQNNSLVTSNYKQGMVAI